MIFTMRLLCFILMMSLFIPEAVSLSFVNNNQVDYFAARMERRYGLSAAEILASLHKAQPKPKVLAIIRRAPETVDTWRAYRAKFVDPQHIRDGRKFMRQHSAAFKQVQETYGLPREVITAIIGIETNYGRLDGGYRTIDALATLAFSDYKRNHFFRRELEEFFLLASEQNKDPLSYRSSYAGAMGLGQFLPSSYRNYGVDFDNDGEVLLHQSFTDSIGSIAYYLSAHGWRLGEPIALAAKQLRKETPPSISGFMPKSTLAGLERKYGIVPLDPKEIPDKALLIKLEGETPELWLGFHNYYVLSRYNPSRYYVMALFFLSQEIAADKSEKRL